MAVVFPDGSGLFQWDNSPWHTEEIVQEWFEEHTVRIICKIALLGVQVQQLATGAVPSKGHILPSLPLKGAYYIYI